MSKHLERADLVRHNAWFEPATVAVRPTVGGWATQVAARFASLSAALLPFSLLAWMFIAR